METNTKKEDVRVMAECLNTRFANILSISGTIAAQREKNQTYRMQKDEIKVVDFISLLSFAKREENRTKIF
jgi:hypothetical protein